MNDEANGMDEQGAAEAFGNAEAPINAELTPEQLEDLKTRAAKADENWERFLRLTADFDNYKKRATRERQEAIKFANESLLEKLIPVLDNFESAMGAAQTEKGSNNDSLRTGVSMIHNQLKYVTGEAGLEEINCTGQKFDPSWHEAISHQPSDEVPEGHVLQQMRKGYKLKDRLLRPAAVVVAKKDS